MARFRLARVLRLRTQLRERAQEELAETRAALQTLREGVAVARASQERARVDETAAVARGASGEELHRFRRWEDAARDHETALRAEAARLVEVFVQRREVLLGRRRQERQLELLGERAAARIVEAEKRVAAELLDDLARRGR